LSGPALSAAAGFLLEDFFLEGFDFTAFFSNAMK